MAIWKKDLPKLRRQKKKADARSRANATARWQERVEKALDESLVDSGSASYSTIGILPDVDSKGLREGLLRKYRARGFSVRASDPWKGPWSGQYQWDIDISDK